MKAVKRQLLLILALLMIILTVYVISISNIVNRFGRFENERVPVRQGLFEKQCMPRTAGKDSDLLIIVLTYNRAASLIRLLRSLNNAFYYNDLVRVEVWIDRSVDLELDPQVVSNALNFSFLYGEYCVVTRSQHAGIFGQWLYSWDPWLNDTGIVVILEDDLTVSPYFYKWLKLVHGKYGNSSSINGYSLQGLSMKHTDGRLRVIAPEESIVYLYPVLGTWGFSPERERWKEFLVWFNTTFHQANFHPTVPGLITTQWYYEFRAAGREDGFWSVWHIYYAWKNQHFTLYPWFENGKRDYIY